MEKIYINIKERVLYVAKENFLLKIGMTYGSFKGKAKKAGTITGLKTM